MLELVLFVISTALSFLTRPKPKSVPAPEVGDVEAPVINEGGELSVLFGTREFSGSNIVDWGNVKTTAIRK